MKKIIFLSICVFAVNSLFAYPTFEDKKNSGKTNKTTESGGSVDKYNKSKDANQTSADRTQNNNSESTNVMADANNIGQEIAKVVSELLKNEVYPKIDSLTNDANKEAVRADEMTIKCIQAHLRTNCTNYLEDLIGWCEQIKNAKAFNKERFLDVLKLYDKTRTGILELAKKELEKNTIRNSGSSDKKYNINQYTQKLHELDYHKNRYRNKYRPYTSPYLNKMFDISERALKEDNMDLLKELLDM